MFLVILSLDASAEPRSGKTDVVPVPRVEARILLP